MIVMFYHGNLKDCLIKVLTSKSNRMLNPSWNYVGTKAKLKCNGYCLEQENILFHHGKIVNIYTVYVTDRYFNISNYSTLENCLLGELNQQKLLSIFSIGDEVGRNVIFFGVGMSSS